MQNVLGGSIGGEHFSTIYGDLINKITINREVKEMGQFTLCSTYSIVLIVLQREWLTALSYDGSNTKEIERKTFVCDILCSQRIFTRIKKQVWQHCPRPYKSASRISWPFLEAPAWQFKSGVQIEKSNVDGLLKSQTVGESCLKELIKDWIKAPSETKIRLFNTIPLENIATRSKKQKKQEKKFDVLKEDCQVFGLLVAEVKTPEEALIDPLTPIPQALANPDNSLRQVCKATLNHLVTLCQRIMPISF